MWHIQLNINGYLLHIHNVYYVPSLQYCLYSVKRHRKYDKCDCVFDKEGSTLIFPKFQFDIDDEFDMLIFARSISKHLPKNHWSSLDGTNSSGNKASIQNLPIKLPSHKPIPNKQTHC